MEKTKQEYISNICVGNIVAFKREDLMFSGKVIEVSEDKVTIQTPNNSIFYVERENVVWVKSFWNYFGCIMRLSKWVNLLILEAKTFTVKEGTCKYGMGEGKKDELKLEVLVLTYDI